MSAIKKDSFLEKEQQVREEQNKVIKDGRRKEELERTYKRALLDLEEDFTQEKHELEEQYHIEREQLLDLHQEKYVEQENIIREKYDSKEAELKEEYEHAVLRDTSLTKEDLEKNETIPSATPVPTPAPAPQDDFSELKAAIADNAKEFTSADIGNAMIMNPVIRTARENAFVMETGKHVKVQPFRLTDSNFKVVSKDMLERILSETKIDAIEYTAESMDCEDFARFFVNKCVSLGINSVGRVFSWTGKHAFCVAVVYTDTGLDFLFIEPQSDEIVEVGEGMYDLENSLIIIS